MEWEVGCGGCNLIVLEIEGKNGNFLNLINDRFF